MENREKSSNLSCLWIDVGGLLTWKQNLTGIQRTVLCLLEEWLALSGFSFRLCAYDRGRRTFCEVPRKTIEKIIQSCHIGHRAPTEKAEPVQSILKRVVQKVGAAVSRTLPRDLHVSSWHAKRAARLFARCVLRSVRLRGEQPSNECDPCRECGHYSQHAIGLRRKQAGFQPLMQDRAIDDTGQSSALFGNGDLLFLPLNSWDDPGSCEALALWRSRMDLRVVSMMYDIIPLKLPQLVPSLLHDSFGVWLPEVLGVSDLVLAISEHTRRDLLDEARNRGWSTPPVEVIRLGDELPRHVPSTRPRDLPVDLETSFALYVGTIESRKNPELLYHLWRRLVQRHGSKTPPLILAGRPGWLTADLLYLMQIDPLLQGKLLLLPDLTDPELRWLYQECLFTLYPSHYEGWGLPVAESLAHGKFCICSNASSLPEIAGDLVEYHDPLDLPGCLALVERALFEPGFLDARQERVRRDFLVTPWQATAQQVLDALRHRLGINPDNASLAVALSARKVG